MKTARLLFIFLALSLKLSAQDYHDFSSGILTDSETISAINLKHEIQLFNPIHLLVEPQFGGLFDASLKQVKGISNLKKFYTNPDFGLKLVMNQKMNEHLNLKALYHVGMLKFNDSDSLKASGYIVKISINYIF